MAAYLSISRIIVLLFGPALSSFQPDVLEIWYRWWNKTKSRFSSFYWTVNCKSSNCNFGKKNCQVCSKCSSSQLAMQTVWWSGDTNLVKIHKIFNFFGPYIYLIIRSSKSYEIYYDSYLNAKPCNDTTYTI